MIVYHKTAKLQAVSEQPQIHSNLTFHSSHIINTPTYLLQCTEAGRV